MADAILCDMESSGIYQIRNTMTGKCYIGSAQCFRIRWGQHRNKLKKSVHHSPHMQHSWNRHGAENFVFEILEICERSELIAREQAWIDQKRPAFNVCPVAGSTLGRKFSEETKAKISAKQAGRKHPPRGDDYRANLSAALKGKKKTEEHMAALQAGRKRQVYTEERRNAVSESLRASYEDGRRSREKSEDHKNKIGRFFAKLADDQIREIRKLRETGATLRSIAEQFGTNPPNVLAICNGTRYRWVV